MCTLAECEPITLGSTGGYCGLKVGYKRISSYGYGVEKYKSPAVKVYSQGTPEKEAVQIYHGRNVLIYLTEGYNDEIRFHATDFTHPDPQVLIQGSPQTTMYLYRDDYTGIVETAYINYICDVVSNDETLTYAVPVRMGLTMVDARGRRVKITTGTHFNRVKSVFEATVRTALANGIKPTYYQIQWALLNDGEYKEPDDAKLSCYQAGYDWLKYDYEETEETT